MVQDALGIVRSPFHLAIESEGYGIKDSRFSAPGRSENPKDAGTAQAGKVDLLGFPVTVQS
jgi:hypothetical protein